VLACPPGARLFGDIKDPESEVSKAIRDNGGYQLMPEAGTNPANHYLPRRKTLAFVHEDQLQRADNPLSREAEPPKFGGPTIDDASQW